tara:strand:- start:417 stop:788 length:372 start_codon:yes stop_codon:yes gene_type:complete
MITATRTDANVPIWDLKDLRTGCSIGLMTNFPGEGPTSTVRLSRGDEGVTVKASALHICLFLARENYEKLYDDLEFAHDEIIEDEDGCLAHAKQAENEAQAWADRERNILGESLPDDITRYCF